MIQRFDKIHKVSGVISLPGDKSISHRSVMFSALADGTSTIKNISHGEDVKSTIKCFKQLGIDIREDEDVIVIHGAGYKGLTAPNEHLDAGNSGTTARLLSGILAMQDFESTIIGDQSLSKRPMDRVTVPLSEFGALFETTEKNTLPMKILPSKNMKSTFQQLNVKSAQVKSALLLAGLHLEEESTVIEEVQTRNHTEVMLQLPVTQDDSGTSFIKTSKQYYPTPRDYFVPSDISSAAFFVVLALLVPEAELIIEHVSLNPTRTGFLDVLMKMGADITIENKHETSNELFGDVVVRSSKLKNIDIPEEIIPNIIDEIPILSIAGIFAEGDFSVRNAKELRVKECDRIHALCENFRKLGADVQQYDDGFILKGEMKHENNILFESYHDHRIAMAFSVFAMCLGGFGIKDFDCVKISNPDYLNQLRAIIQ